MINYYVPQIKDSLFFSHIEEKIKKRKIGLAEAYSQTNAVNSLNSETDIMTDDSFKNGTFTSKRLLKNIHYSDTTLVVSISNISKGYYDFLDVQKKAGKLFNQLIKEPLSYPSNVQNGYGYFNAYLPDYRYFNLKTP